jgi:uncharacterized membrane protein YgdD (TMEM256/DUF423 family)
MLNPWMRIQDILGALGLLFGAYGLIAIGLQLKSKWIKWLGFVSALLFLLFLAVLFCLLIRDYIDLYPFLKRSFFGFRY